MTRVVLERGILSVVAAAMLVGCAGSQTETTAIPQVAGHRALMASSSSCGSDCCPASPNGSGILPDGDLSLTHNWKDGWFTWKKYYTPAPDWTVSKGTIDVYGSVYWDIGGLCSFDLDGYSPGGVVSSPFRTKPGASYTLSFLFSGNGGSSPTTKTLVISIDHQSTIFTWDTSGGNDVQNGDYSTETWRFEATKRFSLIKFTSKDPPGSASGPVVAGIAITQN